MKCPACGYENAPRVLVCNSCARLLPEPKPEPEPGPPPAEPAAVSDPGGPLPQRFTFQLRFLGFRSHFTIIDEIGQTLFRVATKGVPGSKGLHFLPEHPSVSPAAFVVRREQVSVGTFSFRQRVEDADGNPIGSIQTSQLSWSSPFLLETAAGFTARMHRSYLPFLTSLLYLVPHVGHLARLLAELIIRRTIRLHADDQIIVTYRRYLTRMVVEVHAGQDDFDPRLAMAAAPFLFWGR